MRCMERCRWPAGVCRTSASEPTGAKWLPGRSLKRSKGTAWLREPLRPGSGQASANALFPSLLGRPLG